MNRDHLIDVGMVAVPMLMSVGTLTVAWPSMWPQALVRPLAALGQHGDPVIALEALTGTLWTLSQWAWSDAPLVVVCAAFWASFSVWIGVGLLRAELQLRSVKRAFDSATDGLAEERRS